MHDLATPDLVPATPPALPARPLPRAGAAAGLLAALAVALWCLHWLAQAQLWATEAGQPAQAGKYLWAMGLLLPALGGVCFFLNRLWGGPWLRWLAAVLLCAEGAGLAAALAIAYALHAARPALGALLALGAAACWGAAYYLLRPGGARASRAPLPT
ncbi:hypothetical protein [Hymenobacter latericus]|uniref:hypothetical protein n=1 Tax=Hymenobacter sp. YIM 151858-1 TaxID=2987688 RepID=UPI0022272FAD|nr:hypothetical protein [Hymenobacter sp. YIM 151858-1]UYZ59123.1 hypothetical protein OIS50_18950 [Hymenobacter sp. YIM 151858-1]